MKKKEVANKEANDLSFVLSKLAFLPEAIIDASVEQTTIFEKAADYRVKRMEEKARAKAAKEEREARIALALRQEARENGDKLTEANLEHLLLDHPEIQKLRQTYDSAEAIDEYSKLIVEACRMRRDCLEIVGNLAVSGLIKQGMNVELLEKLKGTRDNLRKKYPGGL